MRRVRGMALCWRVGGKGDGSMLHYRRAECKIVKCGALVKREVTVSSRSGDEGGHNRVGRVSCTSEVYIVGNVSDPGSKYLGYMVRYRIG